MNFESSENREKAMQLLCYEKKLCMEIMGDDGLAIVGKGMSHCRVIAALVHAYSHPSCLVLVVNCSALQEGAVRSMVKDLGMPCELTLMRDVSSAAGREPLYYKGGVFFMPSRMVIYDMLVKRIPMEKITGVIVCKAHKVDNCSKEAFVVRLYRETNTNGFLKAISDSPSSFVDGFCRVESIMKHLMVDRLFLYPRFHVEVKKSLERHHIEVGQVQVPMDSTLQTVQSTLFELLEACLKELKGAVDVPLHTSVNPFKADCYMGQDCSVIFKKLFDPVWQLLSIKAKTLIYEVKFLRQLLTDLTRVDCVTFYDKLNRYRLGLNTNRQMFINNTLGCDSFVTPSTSYWLMMGASATLFNESYRRVIAFMNSLMNMTELEHNRFDWLLQLCPKWSSLYHTYRSIREKDPDASVLVLTTTASAECATGQLENLLSQPATILRRYGTFAISLKLSNKSRIEKLNVGSSTKLDMPTRESLTNFSKIIDSFVSHSDSNPKEFSHSSGFSVISYDDTVDLDHLVPQDLKPTYVVVYDCQVSVVRQLELFRHIHPELSFEVLLMLPKDSLEQKKYFLDVKIENEAFKELIEQKCRLPLSKANRNEFSTKPGETNLSPGKDSRLLKKSENIVTDMRSVKKPVVIHHSKIVVDLREFNSKLPFLIHKTGIVIVPKQLEIADYILSDDTAVERKSLGDLVSSLENGRLYSQAINMTKNFSRAILLIEFDPKSSSKTLKSKLFRSTSHFKVQTRIAVAVMTFPELRFMWSMSPTMSVDLFLHLKTNRPEPVESQYLDCDADGPSYTATSGRKINSSRKSADVELKEMICMLAYASKTAIVPSNSPEPLTFYKLFTWTTEELTHFFSSQESAHAFQSFINRKIPLNV